MSEETHLIRLDRRDDDFRAAMVRFSGMHFDTDMVLILKEHKRDRSLRQNKLQRLWLNEAALQGDQTAEEYRAYCKLHFGVPIMREESDDFREAYDRVIKHLPYEHKLAMMSVPLDFPVTSLMTTKQKDRYLDVMKAHFSGNLGFRLTDPNLAGLEYR